MSHRSIIAVLIAAVAASAILLHFFAREASAAWAAFAVHPEIRASLREELDDLKSMARLDPGRAGEYRRRFESTQQLLHRIEVLEMNRDAIVARYEHILLVGIVALMTFTAGAYLVIRRREQEQLAGRRRAQLDQLTSWQESARRLAHELRTPLTAARMEAEKLRASAPDAAAIGGSIVEELDVLASFTTQFTSFAAVGAPVLKSESLHQLLSEFVERFTDAWPNVRLALHDDSAREVIVNVDREMMRRVLANLCSNSSFALASRSGQVSLRLHASDRAACVDVVDDAGGIDPCVAGRLFTPYVTTRASGEGMGLGLAISKKIMLDHAGDLEIVETGRGGTTFRLTVPLAEAR